MPEINLVFNGARGDAVERFAALAGKPVDKLILSWIEDKVDHALVVAMRAGGATWEAVAAELRVSITQARRIYAAGSEFQPIGKEDVRVAEKYLTALEEIKELTSNADTLFPVPSENDLDMIKRYWDVAPSEDDRDNMFPTPGYEEIDMIKEYINALPDASEIKFPTPGYEEIGMIKEYINALPDASEIEFPVPSDEEIEAVERYSKATRVSKKKP
jgi:hypothetical protein